MARPRRRRPLLLRFPYLLPQRRLAQRLRLRLQQRRLPWPLPLRRLSNRRF